jgi:high-affinity iron transporter
MLPSFLLALREGIEGALIIGIILGALQKTGQSTLNKPVWVGTFSGIACSILAALLLIALGTTLQGKAEQIFEGITMLIASAILTWMIYWMRGHARKQTISLEMGVEQAVSQRAGRGLFLLAFAAVLREGIELALFLTTLSFSTNQGSVFFGALIGLLAAVGLAWLLNRSLIHLNLKKFFNITSILLTLFAAGLVAHGVHEFNEAGWIPAIIEHIWDTNNILNDNSVVGSFLKALFGYNGSPSLSEVLAYGLYFLTIAASLLAHRQPQKSNSIPS